MANANWFYAPTKKIANLNFEETEILGKVCF